jgi:hypothetical protein
MGSRNADINLFNVHVKKCSGIFTLSAAERVSSGLQKKVAA